MYKPSDSYYKEFTTASPSTGAAANADSTPVATANHNGTDDGSFALTVTSIDTGRYKITGTVPSGYTKGDVVNVTVAATCSAVAGKACVDTFNVDSKRIGDLNDIAATAIVSAGAITTSSGAVSTVTTVSGNVGGNVTGSVGSISGVTFPSNFAALGITSGGKIGEVALVDTLTTYTGNTPQTGDSYALANGASGFSAIHTNTAAIAAKLPANNIADETLVIAATTSILSAVGSPMQVYTQPTGFLAATFPGTVASTTNITAGTVGSVTGAVGSVTGAVSINLSQTGLSPRALDTVSDAALTVGDALVASLCAAAGKESVSGTSYVVQTPHTGTTIRTFALDSSSAPTTRS